MVAKFLLWFLQEGDATIPCGNIVKLPGIISTTRKFLWFNRFFNGKLMDMADKTISGAACF
jgi:hypothetical protein